MSTIECLSIHGIRSFGIKAEDKQNITFSSPVTLILGANGCGKTTIIECIKYALTGEVPPGSDRGKNFIHDPKIFDFVECLGQAKLVTRNARGEYLTITRSMKIGVKRGKPSFENLDSAVTYGKDDNEKDMHSRRAIDVDAEVSQFMGVSKAIINNVLFCHQEDSSWPLDEGKKLKEKFDAIFGTSEYNKTIDKFIKMRKEQMDIKKNKDADLKIASHMKKETENKNLELDNYQKKFNDLQITRSKLDETVKPIDDRLAQILKIEDNIGRIQANKIELATKLKNCRDQIKSLATKIKKFYDGDKIEIDREISNFREKMCDKRNQLQSLEDQLILIKNQEKKLSQILTEFDRKRINLLNQRQQEQDLISERAKKTTQLCSNLKIPLTSDLEDDTNNEIVNLFQKIQTNFKLEEKKISDISANHDKIDHEKQIEIDKYRERKTIVENDITSKRTQKIQQENDYRKIESDITTTELDAKTLASLTEHIEKLDKTYTQYCESINLNDKRKEIDNKKVNIKKLQVDFSKLDEKLTFLNSISKTMAQINLFETDLEKRELEVRRVKNKHSDNMRKIFPSRVIETNFKRNFQSAYDDLQRKIKDLNSDINKNRLKENELEIRRKNKKDEIIKFEKELQDSKETIFDKCHSTPYEDLLVKSKENIQKLQLDYGAFKSAESMYKKYIKKIEENPCCPLCHNKMTTNEASVLSNEMTDEIHRLPENINRTAAVLKKEQTKYENLLSLKPIIDKVSELEKNIPKSKENLNTILTQLAEASNDLETSQLLTAEPNSNLELVNGMLGDMSLLDEALKDVNRLQNELQKLKANLPEGSSSASLEDVQLEKTTVAAELDNERSEFDQLETEYDKENEYLNKLREKKNTLKERQIKMQEGVQSLPQLKLRRDEISVKIESLTKEIKILESQLDPLKLELTMAIEEKDKLKTNNRTILSQMNSQLDSLKTIDRDIKRCSNELKNFTELNLIEEIELLKNKIKRSMDEQTTKAKENTETTGKIEQLKMEISNQELLERDLRDNRELKEYQEKEEDLNQKNIELSKNIGQLDYKNITKEREELTKKREDVTVKKGELLGQIGEINNQIRKIETELNDTKYKDSVSNYRRIFYEVVVLKKIIDDLGQYRVALEWALMKFHSEKMEKINRLIREYWRQIYRGNDIDYIQIQTTDENKTVGDTSADKKRSYNYRVVQCKNHAKIDMRGRCSAGQRVLASLIIRMALAETFSSNCGVLALDEPTTNLDRQNILSLCEALNRIVEERQTQSNFMLIIITHDEDFISTLGKIRSYHKVYRNKDGKSFIRRVKVA